MNQATHYIASEGRFESKKIGGKFKLNYFEIGA